MVAGREPSSVELRVKLNRPGHAKSALIMPSCWAGWLTAAWAECHVLDLALTVLLLCSGPVQIQFNLSDFTRRAYGTNYIETLRVQIHANCRIRRIYFSDRLYSEVGPFPCHVQIQSEGCLSEL